MFQYKSNRGMCGGLEGTGRVCGDSRQRNCGTWAPSGQRADPISPDTLDASALHLVLSHLCTAALPGRVHEEWPRLGRGSEPAMNSGGSGGGQNRPWQGGGNGPGHPNPNYRGNNYNPYYYNNSNWNRGYNNWRPTNYEQKSSNQQAASDPGQAG
jgi:hypothetical protein